jgi:tRNA1(Val) A37 N6-methylase TrmN6
MQMQPQTKIEASTEDQKQFIARRIKNITETMAIEDFRELQRIGENAGEMSCRCRKGNDVVDYFTFRQRLETRGKYDVTFFEFLEQLEEFKKKKFIANMLKYYEDVKNKNKTKNEYIVYKEVYNICVSAINIFRPLMAMEIYAKYKPQHVVDFCAGWGGRLIGAFALNVPRYTGIEINRDLMQPYQKMVSLFKQPEYNVTTDVSMRFEDATQTDFSQLPSYDMVFTSPPYFFLEKYPNNEEYKSKDEMRTKFYNVVFKNSYDHLKPGGYFCININQEIYELCCVPLFGNAAEVIPLKKSQRQNDYGESIYIYKK